MTHDPEVVEVVARGIYAERDHFNVDPWDTAMERGKRHGITPPMITAALRAATAALDALRASGKVVVPVVPTPGLLMSIALRADHGLAVPGYYDGPLFARSGVTHAMRLDAAITQAKQMHEEVVGTGFYNPEREADYTERLAATRPTPSAEAPTHG